MAVESAADRAGLFHTDEWAETAQWSAKGAWDPSTVEIVLSRDTQSRTIGGVEVRATLFIAMARVEQLPTGAGEGDRITLAATGEDFVVVAPLEYDETRTLVTALLRPSGD